MHIASQSDVLDAIKYNSPHLSAIETDSTCHTTAAPMPSSIAEPQSLMRSSLVQRNGQLSSPMQGQSWGGLRSAGGVMLAGMPRTRTSSARCEAAPAMPEVEHIHERAG